MKILCKPNICMGLEFSDPAERSIFTESLWFVNPNPDRSDTINPYYDGRVNFFLDIDKQKFPTGLLGHVLSFLGSRGIIPRVEVAVQPERSTLQVDPEVCDGMILRDYQVEAVNAAMRNNRGLIAAPPRSGKTLMQAALAKTLGKKSVIFVQRANLLEQHVDNLTKWGLDPGIVQGSTFDEGKTHYVAMLQTVWNNIKNPKFQNWLQSLSVMQIDEVHHASSSDTYYRTGLHCPASWRLGYSGTPFSILDMGEGRFNPRSWRLVGLCGPTLKDISMAKLRDVGLLTPVRVVQIRETGPDDVRELDGASWHPVYEQGVVNNKQRNTKIAGVCAQLVAQGYLPLVLVKYVSHGEDLFDRMRNDNLIPLFSRGGKTIQQSVGLSGSETIRGSIRDAYAKLKRGEGNILIATQIGDEGVDLPDVDALVLAVGGKSDQVTTQRIFRPLTSTDSKKSAIVVDFDDQQHGVLKRQSATRRRIYRMLGFDVTMCKYSDFFVEPKA